MSRTRTVVAAMIVAAAVGVAPAVPAAASGDVGHRPPKPGKLLKHQQSKLTPEQKAAIAVYRTAVRAAQQQHRAALRAVKDAYVAATAAARQVRRDALAVATTRAERRAARLAYLEDTAAARAAAQTGVLAANRAYREAHHAAWDALKQAFLPAPAA
jgi:hypothetical protein